ncbi:MAG: phage tail protein I [Armatimonadota bacterium]
MTNFISKLSDVALRDLLPPSISEDDQMIAIADGLDTESHKIVDDTAKYLPYIPGLDDLPSRIVDLLAWQYHLDNYDASASITVRRSRVRQAIAEHKIHGTRSMVDSVLTETFGEGGYTLIEWWENTPKQAAYTFRVFIHEAFTADDIADARRKLAVVSNVRSHWIGSIIWSELDAFGYTWTELDALALTWSQMDGFYFNIVVS